VISLHGGRLLLHCEQAHRTWHCTIALGPKQRKTYDTGRVNLQQALLAAQQHYQLELRQARSVQDAPICWDCAHWDPQRSHCTLGFPEARQTGGRFAARCSVFRSCP
jgi:hypothetical protein